MFPWGVLVSVAGQAVSGIASAINNKRMQGAADREDARQQAYYTAKANENPLSRSENQHLLGQYDRDAQRQVENARGVANITGATPEYALGVQKAVAEGRANLMGNMSAGASQRADYYEQRGESARHQKFYEDQERKAARNQTYANLAANAANAFGGIIDSYTTGGARKAPSKEPSEGVTPVLNNTPDAIETKTAEQLAWEEMERAKRKASKATTGTAVFTA